MASPAAGAASRTRNDPGRLTIDAAQPGVRRRGDDPPGIHLRRRGRVAAAGVVGRARGGQGLALICRRPDAPMGTFTHWVVVELPPRGQGAEGRGAGGGVVPAASMVTAGDVHVRDTAPARGRTISARSAMAARARRAGRTAMSSGSTRWMPRSTLAGKSPTRADVLKAIEGHILAEGRLIRRNGHALGRSDRVPDRPSGPD